MRKIITVLILLFVTVSTFAQQGINYKALIKDDSGIIVANTNIVLQFTIYEGDALTNEVYVEQHAYTTNANGFVILTIGEGNTVDDFNTINWGNDEHFINVQVSVDGGNLIDLGTTQFMAVPYAKHATTAANVFSGDYNDLINQPTTLPSGLEQITENDGTQDKTGWRLVGRNPNSHLPIGEGAIDFSTFGDVSGGASGDYSMAIGPGSVASGDSSFCRGYNSNASGAGSTVIGSYSSASGNGSITYGYASSASGVGATVIGSWSNVSGFGATAIGLRLEADSYYSFALGRYNIGGGTPGSWVVTDPLFVIGNGVDDDNRNNAVTVLKNGKVGIGRAIPSSLLEVAHENSPPTSSDYTNAFSIHNISTGGSWQFSTVNTGHLSIYKNGSYRGFFNESSGTYSSISDRRVKKDIISIEDGTLAKVMQLNPVSYLMKDQKGSKRNVGLISQEVKEIFPSITHYVKESDLLTLSYSELIPILIKALQEQQTIIEAQNSKIDSQALETSQQNAAILLLIQRMNALEAANN
ncbi:MAG: tail fiber domain-containing protein [Kordia sp.]|uniref:tail fiber domain-containing protein n=1 Tax=Kordia sp. TaxID=1965332 RepID=UPI00385A1221